MLSLANYNLFQSPNEESFAFCETNKQACVTLIEGITEYDTLCPVSKLTGHRVDPTSLLRVALSDKNSRLLSAILQDLPEVNSMPGVSDEQKIELLVSRHATGTMAEQDIVREQLASIADVLFVNQPELKEQSQDSIDFTTTEVPEVSKEQ